jgi:sulfur carrier protein
MPTIDVTINGRSYQFNDEITVVEILDTFKLNRNNAIVEYNRKIINKDNLETIKVTNGDSLEIVRFVGGG